MEQVDEWGVLALSIRDSTELAEVQPYAVKFVPRTGLQANPATKPAGRWQ